MKGMVADHALVREILRLSGVHRCKVLFSESVQGIGVRDTIGKAPVNFIFY